MSSTTFIKTPAIRASQSMNEATSKSDNHAVVRFSKTSDKRKPINFAMHEINVYKLVHKLPGVISFEAYFLVENSNGLSIRMELEHMDYDLCQWIRSSYQPEYVDDIQKQIVLTVADLHSMQVAHLDIKPENILIQVREDKPQIRFCDFEHSQYQHDTKTLRKEDQYCRGTVVWNAPECFVKTGRNVFAIDVFAVGLVLRSLHTQLIPWDEHRSCCRVRMIRRLYSTASQCDEAGCFALRLFFRSMVRVFPENTAHVKLIDSMNDLFSDLRPTMCEVVHRMYPTAKYSPPVTNKILTALNDIEVPEQLIEFFDSCFENKDSDNMLSAFWLFRNIEPKKILKSPELVSYLDELCDIAGTDVWATVMMNEILLNLDLEGPFLRSAKIVDFLANHPNTIMSEQQAADPAAASDDCATSPTTREACKRARSNV